MGDLDIDAIRAAWRGFEGELRVHESPADEDGSSEVTIVVDDDNYECTLTVATVMCDSPKCIAALWAGAGPQVASLLAEVERLRAEREAAFRAGERYGMERAMVMAQAVIQVRSALGHGERAHGAAEVHGALDRALSGRAPDG